MPVTATCRYRPAVPQEVQRSMDEPGVVSHHLDDLLPGQGTVLALGVGDGRYAERLATGDRRIVAAVPLAGTFARIHGDRNVTWVRARAGALPLADGSVDAAWASLRPSLLDASRRLAELHRVVAPGGPIVVVDDADDGVTRTRVAVTSSTGPPDVRIRGMRRAEAQRVGAITLRGYDAEVVMEGEYRDFLADPLRRLDRCTALLVAVLDGAVVGTVSYVLPSDGAWEARPVPDGDCSFRVLAVDPDVQGRGIGRHLAEACIARARDAGCRRMMIASMAVMIRAHRLYESLGFVRRPDLDVRFPGGDGLVFTYDLVPDAAAHFPPAGQVPDPLPWYADAWT